MSQPLIIEAQSRAKAGTGTSRSLRREGMIPAIVYGNKQEPEMIAVNAREINKELQHAGFFSRLINLSIAGKNQNVLVKDVQIHPVTDLPLHVDFMRVNKDSKVHVSVQLHFVNEDKAPAIKRGGLLNVIVHSLEVVCSPESIPESLNVDLNGLEMHHSVQLSSIKLPAGVKAAHPERDAVIATVVAPAGEDKATAEEAE
jgi:large subunit ribosomal protein L25